MVQAGRVAVVLLGGAAALGFHQADRRRPFPALKRPFDGRVASVDELIAEESQEGVVQCERRLGFLNGQIDVMDPAAHGRSLQLGRGLTTGRPSVSYRTGAATVTAGGRKA